MLFIVIYAPPTRYVSNCSATTDNNDLLVKRFSPLGRNSAQYRHQKSFFFATYKDNFFFFKRINQRN